VNTFKRKSLFTAALASIVASVLTIAAMLPVPAQAATPNYSASNPSVVVLPFHISGQYAATTAGVVKFNLPFRARLIGIGANARASGGTSPTLTVDLKVGGSTILTAPISITAGTYAEGAIGTSSQIPDEASVTVDLTIGGTSPTWNDITVLLTLVRT
jgi:hypothetical protein